MGGFTSEEEMNGAEVWGCIKIAQLNREVTQTGSSAFPAVGAGIHGWHGHSTTEQPLNNVCLREDSWRDMMESWPERETEEREAKRVAMGLTGTCVGY